MPWIDLDARRRYQREWRKRKRREDPIWHEKEKAAKRDYGHPEFEGLQGLETRANLNERRWRFHIWELSHVNPVTKDVLQHLTQRTFLEISNPIFYFELNGKLQRECLNEPLPKW